MLNIQDYARHRVTGEIGHVIGYGHQLLDGVYVTTLKVWVTNSDDIDFHGKCMEDIYSAWVPAATPEALTVVGSSC